MNASFLTPRPMGEVGPESTRDLERDLIQRVLARLWNSVSASSSDEETFANVPISPHRAPPPFLLQRPVSRERGTVG